MSLHKYRKYILIILSFMSFSFLSMILFLHTHTLFSSGDLVFHISRIMELKESISHSVWLPLFSLNYFHGSAVMSMYPYIDLYPFVLLIYVTHSFIFAYYNFLILITFISLIISFFGSLNSSKSIIISYIFSIVYSISSVYLLNIFGNGDIGAAIASSIAPLAIFGLIDVMNGSTNYIKLSLGLILLMYCHWPSFIIIFGFLFIFIAINLRHISFTVVFNIIKSLVLVLLMTSIVWVPLLYIILQNKIVTVGSIKITGLNISEFLKYLNIFAIISIFMSLVLFKNFDKLKKQLYVISIIIIIGCSKLMPWSIITSFSIFKFFNVFQFSYRFLMIPEVLLDYLFSCSIVLLFLKLNKCKVFITLFSIFIALCSIFNQALIIKHKCNKNPILISNINNINSKNIKDGFIIRNNKYIYNVINDFRFGVGSTDYYPSSAISSSKSIRNDNGLYHANHILGIHHCKDEYNTFIFHNKQYIHKLKLPLLNYNGVRLRIFNNKKLVSYNVDKNHRIVLYNINKGTHKIYIKYILNIKFVILTSTLFVIGIIWILYKCLYKSKWNGDIY